MDEFEEILISTPIDKLIEIIKEEREVTSSYLALKTKYDQATIEEWARYLEREGIVEIKYQLNEMLISWNSPKKEEYEARKEKVKKQTETVEKQIESLKESVNIEIKNIYDIIEMLRGKVEEMRAEREKLLTFISQFDKFREEVNRDIQVISRDLEKISENIDSKYRQVSSMTSLISDISILDVNETEKNIKQSLDEKMKLIDQRINDLDLYISKLQGFSDQEIQNLREKLDGLIEIREMLKESDQIEGGLKELVERYEYVLEVLAEREKLINELEQLESRNREIQNKLNNLTGTIFEINEKLQSIAQEYYEIQTRSAELATQLRNNYEVIKNIEIKNVEVVDRAKEMLNSLRELKGEIASFDKLSKDAKELLERLQDIGRVRANLEKYKKEYLIEVAKYAELVNEDLKTLETLLDIKKRLIGELSGYKDTLLGYEEEFKKYIKLFMDQKESFNSMRTTLNQMIEQGEFSEAINKINASVAAIENIDQKLEEARRLLVELEEIKINLNVLNKELSILKLRTPETEKDLSQRVQHQERALKEQEVKRRSLEDWIRGFTKK